MIHRINSAFIATFLSTILVCGEDSPVKIRLELNTIHKIGGEEGFDRWKFITAHSMPSEPDWIGEEDKLRYLCDELDVYFGRDSGAISHDLSLLREDPNHPGYVEFSDMKRRGEFSRNEYSKKNSLHRLANRSDIVITAQVAPFWPASGKIQPEDGTTPWTLAGPEATAQYMVYWLNMYTGGNGPPRPKFLEIMNEPLYELSVSHPEVTPKEVFEFHRKVARGIRKLNKEIYIGGYTAAFPDFEKDDFQRWETRWKSFIDLLGDEIDFYSFHLYDFPGINGGQKQYRKGANLEATFDLLEHYSMLKFGRIKPFLISEYGSQLHDWYKEPWSPYRDWLCLKAINSMLLQMSAKPDRIHKAIPFIPAKAEWGFNYGNSNQPYYWRLLRKENEPVEYAGKWVFTDLIKFYQLWSGVRGTRRWIESSDPEVLAACHLDGKEGFLIFNNLSTNPKTIDFNPPELVTKLEMRHLYLNGNKPVLDWVDLPRTTNEFKLGSEATMVVKLSFSKDQKAEQQLRETKYYAKSYMQRIQKDQPLSFVIEKVSPAASKTAVLRLGIGRDHGQSLFPAVSFNGQPVNYQHHYRGPAQNDRSRFFGVLEISIPVGLVKENNDIQVTFSDSGGHVSSVAMTKVSSISGSPDRIRADAKSDNIR